MASKKPYKRLPGTGYRKSVPPWVVFAAFFAIGIFALMLRGRRVQLWEGEEELLLVESNGSTENYKRFKYRDIQAFIIRRTESGRIGTTITLGLAVIAGALAIPASQLALRITLIIIAGLFGLIGVVNAGSGPTCECFIRTAVQTDDIPSLTRLPRAQKVLARLRPRVAAVQGELNPQEIPPRLREMLPPIFSTQPVVSLSISAPAATTTVTTPETSLAPPISS